MTAAAEEQALTQVKRIKGFYIHLIIYALVMLLLLTTNLYDNADNLWVFWPAAGWGIGLLLH